MMLVWICAVLFVGTAIGQGGKEPPRRKAEVPSMANNFLGRKDPDPLTIKPCLSDKYYPVEKFTILDTKTTLIDEEWWRPLKKGVRSLRKIENIRLPKELRNNKYLSKKNLEEKEIPKPEAMYKPDFRFYYWQVECPYKVYWLTAVYQKFAISSSATKLMWCYILNPWWVKARMVKCSTEFCKYRCVQEHKQVRNSVCLQNHYRSYTVWVFCPDTLPGNMCKKTPWKCFRRITIRLPQCCECWSCWSMFITHNIGNIKTAG